MEISDDNGNIYGAQTHKVLLELVPIIIDQTNSVDHTPTVSRLGMNMFEEVWLDGNPSHTRSQRSM